MQNRDKGWASREEILRRLNADEELLGTTEARFDPAEEERQRKLNNEIERNRRSTADGSLGDLGQVARGAYESCCSAGLLLKSV